MGDSQSKTFGDDFLGKLQGELNKPAGVYGKSLFTGAGQGTKDAWTAGNTFADSLNRSGGFGSGQRGAMNSLGGVFSGYGGVADNNGLTTAQAAAMSGNTGLGAKYAGLSTAYDPNSAAFKTLRRGVADDTLTGVASLGASNGRYGARTFNEGAAEGLGDALAGLDYNNMQNNVNNQYRSLDSQRGIFGDTFNMGQTGVGNTLAGLAGQAGVAGQQFGMGQTALTNRQGALDLMTRIGAGQDANAQGARLGDADLWDRRQNGGLDRLGKIGAIFGDPTAAANEAPWWQQGLGALLGFGGNAVRGGLFGGGS